MSKHKRKPYCRKHNLFYDDQCKLCEPMPVEIQRDNTRSEEFKEQLRKTK